MRGFLELENVAECHAFAGMEILQAGIDSVVGDWVKFVRRVYEMIARIVGLREKADGGNKDDSSCNSADPPKPLDGKLLTDPTVDEGTKGRTRSQEEGVNGHLGTTFMKEED
jgi:hypothetical protein